MKVLELIEAMWQIFDAEGSGILDKDTCFKLIAEIISNLALSPKENIEEIYETSFGIFDKNGNIIDPLHKTIPLLTKYEKARIIGARAEQLAAGSESYIPLDETIVNGKTIALMEFEQKKIPFIIARPLPNGSTEYWHVSDLENILD